VLVHRAGKHAAELELGDLLLEPVGVRRDAGDRVRVVFLGRDIEQLRAVAGTLGELVEQFDYVLELGALPAESLCFFLVAPDARILELAADFLEPLPLDVVVKGTSSGHPPWKRGPAVAGVVALFP
jgi:hypothetical protein